MAWVRPLIQSSVRQDNKNTRRRGLVCCRQQWGQNTHCMHTSLHRQNESCSLPVLPYSGFEESRYILACGPGKCVADAECGGIDNTVFRLSVPPPAISHSGSDFWTTLKHHAHHTSRTSFQLSAFSLEDVHESVTQTNVTPHISSVMKDVEILVSKVVNGFSPKSCQNGTSFAPILLRITEAFPATWLYRRSPFATKYEPVLPLLWRHHSQGCGGPRHMCSSHAVQRPPILSHLLGNGGHTYRLAKLCGRRRFRDVDLFLDYFLAAVLKDRTSMVFQTQLSQAPPAEQHGGRKQ